MAEYKPKSENHLQLIMQHSGLYEGKQPWELPPYRNGILEVTDEELKTIEKLDFEELQKKKDEVDAASPAVRSARAKQFLRESGFESIEEALAYVVEKGKFKKENKTD